ncbi:MAG: MerR family transcriptional regulator [Bacteroidales bacterium]|jgi:DNA-binding transcriptional MerR regulator|nr:MerR family transcriptional regulator [Bacteroidales bacterium]
MPTYSIKDLENLTGIQAHTIRIWEQRYHLLIPERTPTNIRVYSDTDLRKLLSVALLNNNGLKISKIANLSDTEIAESVLQLSEGDDSNLENQVESLKLIMVDLNEAKFEKLFSHLVLQMGFEETIMKIFIPFFKRLTFLWQTNSVTIAQINFITSLYKQKLYVAIDGLAPSEKVNSKKFILFLPKTERLDNGLLFCNYMAKKRGFQTLYLGVSFPSEELVDILEKTPESYLFSVASLAKTDLTTYYTRVLSMCNTKHKLLLAGSQTNTVKINDSRLTVFQDYNEFRDFLDQL